MPLGVFHNGRVLKSSREASNASTSVSSDEKLNVGD